MKLGVPYRQEKGRGWTEDILCDELLSHWGKFNTYKELTNNKKIDIQLQHNAMTIHLYFEDDEWNEIAPLIITEDYTELYRKLYHWVKYRQAQLVVEKV